MIATSGDRANSSLTRRLLRCDVLDLVTWGNCWLLWSVSYFVHTKILSAVCLIVLLLWPRLRRSPIYWWGVVIAWLPQLVLNWHQNEDHVYLAFYWLAATSLALWGSQPRAVLVWNARLLVGLCFLVAACWKTCSPEFTQGSVLAYKMVEDFRFRELVTTPIAGFASTTVSQFDRELRQLRSNASDRRAIEIPLDHRWVWISHLMTWWTVLIEWGLGLAFLLPQRWICGIVRHAALLVFVISTYAIVPVMGFANIFLLMGFAQTERTQTKLRAVYLAAWVALVLWSLWRTTLLSLAGLTA